MKREGTNMKRQFSIKASNNVDKNSPTYPLWMIKYHLQAAMDIIEEANPEQYDAMDGDSAISDLDLLIRQVDGGIEKMLESK